MTQFDPLTLEILWHRLITIVDEMASILIRTSFSTIVGAANDFGCEIMDAKGHSLAHATRSMPVFNRTLPHVTQAIITKFGSEGLRPGDVFIGNDPWLSAGHHPDVAVVTPFFQQERLMGFAASIAHVADIGGLLDSNLAHEAYEEGLLIPLTRLYDQGQLNETIFDFVSANIRVPDMVIGDIHAQVTANQAGGEKALTLMAEYQLAELQPLADAIQNRSEIAMRQAILAVPDGQYTSQVEFAELDCQLQIGCQVEIVGDEVKVNFEGSSPQQPYGGINCTFVYTRGHTSYGLKCILLPDVPSNTGCYRPIRVNAPEGSLLNARRPASVRMRTRSGWYIHHALFSALAEVLPTQIMGTPGLMGGLSTFATNTKTQKTHFATFFIGGGMGGGHQTDGISTCIYPSSASNVPVELFEVEAPLLVEEKEFIIDSGGPGQQRGGLGVRTSFSLLDNFEGEATASIWVHGQNMPNLGLQGGLEAKPAEIYLDGQRLSPAETLTQTGAIHLNAQYHPRLTLDTAGGGGFGSPKERDPIQVAADVRDGFVSVEQAKSVYGLKD